MFWPITALAGGLTEPRDEAMSTVGGGVMPTVYGGVMASVGRRNVILWCCQAAAKHGVVHIGVGT